MAKSKPFYVWDGIFDPSHRKNIGSALWEFQWCISRITKECDGVGLVDGGNEVKISYLADALGLSDSEIRRNLGRLESNGYIRCSRMRYGTKIEVLKSKRWVGKTTNPDRLKMTDLPDARSPKNDRSEQPQIADSSAISSARMTDLDPVVPTAATTSEALNIEAIYNQKQVLHEHVVEDASDVKEIVSFFNLKIHKRSRLTDEARKKIHARLKTYQKEELLQAIDRFSKDDWWMANNGWRGMKWFFHSDDRMEQLINLVPRGKGGTPTIEPPKYKFHIRDMNQKPISEPWRRWREIRQDFPRAKTDPDLDYEFRLTDEQVQATENPFKQPMPRGAQ